jgi:hypothetical protein
MTEQRHTADIRKASTKSRSPAKALAAIRAFLPRYNLGTAVVISLATVLLLASIASIEYMTGHFVPLLSDLAILDLPLFDPVYVTQTATVSVLGLLVGLASTSLRSQPLPPRVRKVRFVVSVSALLAAILALSLELIY